jgi:hypothetical protein
VGCTRCHERRSSRLGAVGVRHKPAPLVNHAAPPF